MGEDRSQTSRQRVTVAQASEILGVTVEAVRGRIKRGTLDHERHSGTVYVVLDADQMPTGPQPTDDQTTDQSQPDVHEELADELRDRLRYLERELEQEREARRRADTLLAQLMQRIPQLEAPASEHSEPRESPVNPGPSESPTPAPGDAQEGAQSAHSATLRPQGDEARGRPWWRRIFGG